MMAPHHPEELGATAPSSHLRQEGQLSEATPELSAITRLYELSTRLVLSSGLEALLEEVLHAVIELQGADFGNVQLYDPVSETLSIVAQHGFSQPFLDCFRHVSVRERSACGLALSRHDRVIIFDTETDPAYQTFRHMAALSGYRSVQSTPLFTRADEILGMLSIHFRLPHSPSAHELRLTDLYAKQAAEMIERHRMEEELKRTNEALLAEIHERERVEQLLREREAQLETIFETIPDALMITDTSGSVVRVNPAAHVLFGLQTRPGIFLPPLEEQKNTMQVRDEDGQPRPGGQLNHARILRGETITPTNPSITLLRSLDGPERYASTVGAPLYDENGHIRGALTISRDITEQRQAEREREQQIQQLQLQSHLLELAHDAILVCNPASQVLFWNRGAEDLYGWSAEEAHGRITHGLLHTIFPTSLAQVEAQLEHGGHWEGELVHTCRDGRVVVVESRQVLVRDEQGTSSAILEINRDVTGRRRLEQMEQEARAEADVRLQVFQLILDRLPNGVSLVQGPHLRLLLANQAAATLWGAAWPQGQPEEEFLHQHGIQLLTPNGQPLPLEDLTVRRAMATGEPVLHRQLVICQPDGTRLPVVVDAIPFENLSLLPPLPQKMISALPSAERVVLLVYQDVSALKEAETLKDQFISLATHELRTPVTIIAGYADRLLARAARGGDGGLNEWQREKVQEMKQASWQLASLTEDLLDVTRMQAGEFKLELRLTDLVALTGRVVRRTQATTDRHQLAFHTAFSQLWATVDAIRIEQVLSNLLSNAIKYSPAGGPIEVTLEEHAETHEAWFRVRDRGMGIPRAQQAHLFGRFVRGENVRASGIRGTGLGLYLCRELIERHGGQIRFESEEDVGSTFFFSFPCTEAVQQENGNAPHERTDSASPSS